MLKVQACGIGLVLVILAISAFTVGGFADDFNANHPLTIHTPPANISNPANIPSMPDHIGLERKIYVGKVFFPNEEVRITSTFPPRKAFLIDPAGHRHLLKFERHGNVYTANFSLSSKVLLGKWIVFVDRIVKSFYVDFYTINATFNGSEITGKVGYYYVKPEKLNWSAKGVEGTIKLKDAKFSFPVPFAGNYTMMLKCGNAETSIRVNLTENLSVSRYNFVGDVVNITASFQPRKATLITPSGEYRLSFNRSGNVWVAGVKVNETGIYAVKVCGIGCINRSFLVDNYTIHVDFRNSTLNGSVRWNLFSPQEAGLKTEVEIENESINYVFYTADTFEIPVNLTGNVSVFVRCGKYTSSLQFYIAGGGNRTERNERNENETKEIQVGKLYFPGRVVSITSNFEVSNGYITAPDGSKYPLKFERHGNVYTANFSLSSKVLLGKWIVFVDRIVKSFYVDFYTINATFNGSEITGKVGYYYVKPEKLEYVIDGVRREYRLENSSFSIPLTPGNHTVVLICGNAEIRINASVPVSEIENTTGKLIVAYDPVSKEIILKGYGKAAEREIERKIDEVIGKMRFKLPIKFKKIYEDVFEKRIAATPLLLKEFGLPTAVLNTSVKEVKISDTRIRLEVKNKVEVWYRFSVKLPKGYGVGEIVRDDGKKVVNTIHINRATGKVEGDLRWYVENGTLYFYDDPIWGYNISLIPPQPYKSIAVELAYNGTYAGSGQISAIIFPYNSSDNTTTLISHDHAGRTEDNWANEIDIDAGSKIALRFTQGASTYQYGNWYYYIWLWFVRYRNLGFNGNIDELNRTDVELHTAPDGSLEAVIITKMQTAGGEANVTQKVIIRGDEKWFATVYYIEPTTANLTNLRFFQGMDWNFNGDYSDDECYYNSTYDVVYGYDGTSGVTNIQYGGYSAYQRSTAHDVNYYLSMWDDIYNDNLNNLTSYIGDAATALAWDRASLTVGEKWVIPVVWGLGYNFSDMISEINSGKSKLYDAGIKSIDSPANNTRYNPNTAGIVLFNATVALYGIVDLDNLPVIFNVTKVGGGYSYETYTTVNLSVPYSETAKVSFPLNISNLSYGKYKVTFKTNLSNDQNTSNDEKWIYIEVSSFTVEPDQQKIAPPGSEVFYNVTAVNYASAGRYDVLISRSSWPTRLYDAGVVIAYDSNGDGVWDYIAPGYDTNGNGQPDLYIPLGVSYINVSKVIPSSTPLGSTEVTVLNFTFVGGGIYDTVKLTTSTPLPPTAFKSMYLHTNEIMNTSAPSTGKVEVLANSLQSWYQSPPFASSFKIYSDVVAYLWLNASSTSTHDVRLSLISTNGITSTVVATAQQTLTLSSTPALYTFTMPLLSPYEFGRGYYAVLRVENVATTPMYVITGSSNVTFNTTTFVKVNAIDTSQCYVGKTVYVLANVSDPIGSYDISNAILTVRFANGSLYLSKNMDLNSTDPSSPSLWKLYNSSFTVYRNGVYYVTISGIESNGVVYNLTTPLSCFEVNAVRGRVLEDVYPLGRDDGEDVGISNARVALIEDNGNGVIDVNDAVVGLTRTDFYGNYSFNVQYNASREYFVVVDSTSLHPLTTLNPNHLLNETWAEETYQTEWNGTSYAITPKFGGRDPNVSDRFGIDFFDDMETWTGWINYSSGIVTQSSDVAHSGYFSLKKSDFNDPNGGYKLIGKTVGRDIVLEGWVYRPSAWGGGAIDRIGIEDSGFNGYTFRVHHTLNYIAIDSRTAGVATLISSRVSWNPPEDQWYFFRLFVFANGTIKFATYYENGTLGAVVTASDATYSKFDRVVVHGGYVYYVDDLAVKELDARYEHVVSINPANYSGEGIYFGFSYDVVVNTRDYDASPSPRFAQGTLRQFVSNANAISSGDRSYFVMAVPPNSGDGNGKWWTFAINTSLGEIRIEDSQTDLNGTVFYPNMSVRDENPGFVNYDYSTHSIIQTSLSVSSGVGGDGVPDTGDENVIPPIPKPEIEIYGNEIVGAVINVTGDYVRISHLSVFGASTTATNYWLYGFGIKIGKPDTNLGEGCIVSDVLVGMRANASDPKLSGLSRNEYCGIGIYSNASNVVDSAVAFNNGTGILFWGRGVKSGGVYDSIVFRNGLLRAYADGIAVEGWVGSGYSSRASNVTVSGCIMSKNAAYGFDSWFGGDNLRILNSTLELNGIGNETGFVAERGGMRVLSNNSYVSSNLIFNNFGSGVVLGRMEYYPTHGITVSKNSIYDNRFVGIDIDPRPNLVNSYSGDNVTINDGLLNSSQPNYGVDYPVITSASLNGTTLYVEGTSFPSATVEIYLVRNVTAGDNLVGNNVSSTGAILSDYYGEGFVYLGTLIADAGGNFSGSINVSGRGVTDNAVITATATLHGNTSEFGRDYRISVYRNVVAKMRMHFNGFLIINVTVEARNRTQNGIYVYWEKPANVSVLGMSGNYDLNGTTGNLMWWEFRTLSPGNPGRINMTLDTNGEWSACDAFNIAVDPRFG